MEKYYYVVTIDGFSSKPVKVLMKNIVDMRKKSRDWAYETDEAVAVAYAVEKVYGKGAFVYNGRVMKSSSRKGEELIVDDNFDYELEMKKA